MGKRSFQKSTALSIDPLARAHEKIEKLSSLIEIGALVNSTLDLPELLSLVMSIAENVMDCEASSLMLIDQETNELVFQVATGEKGGALKEKFRLKIGQGIAGWVAENNEPLLVPDVRNDPRFYSKPDESTGFITKSIICVPMRAKDNVIGILQAINPKTKKEFVEDDIEIFSAFANQSAIAIENARMHKQMLDKQRIAAELDFARQIQQNFLPETLPDYPNFSVTAKNIPAREVSGDFYDILEFSDSKYGVVLGDVSGKGVPSGLYMVKTISTFRFQASATRSCEETIEAVNNELSGKPQFGMFCTLCYFIFDTNAGEVYVSNAGHLPPILIDHNKKTISKIDGGKGSPLGIMQGMPFSSTRFNWEKGMEVLLYTDGVIEARNDKKEEYGFERLEAVIRTNFGKPGLQQALLEDITLFVGGASQHDDLTVVCVRA